MQLMLDNARQSLALEPGCKQFDVAEDPDEKHKIFLYEVYDDEAAFEAHKTYPHYLEFCQHADPLTTSKVVNKFHLRTTA